MEGGTMLNAVTKKRLEIWPNGEEGGWLQLPAEQIDAVVRLLQGRGLRCWPTLVVGSSDGGPLLGSVVLSRNVKPDVAQAVLDSVP